MDQFDNIKIVKKALKAREVIYKDGVAFLCGRSTHITVVKIEWYFGNIRKQNENKINISFGFTKIIFEHKQYI